MVAPLKVPVIGPNAAVPLLSDLNVTCLPLKFAEPATVKEAVELIIKEAVPLSVSEPVLPTVKLTSSVGVPLEIVIIEVFDGTLPQDQLAALLQRPVVPIQLMLFETVIVILFDVAGEPVKHGVAFEVITTLTVSPFVNADEVKVSLFVPTLAPLTFHW